MTDNKKHQHTNNQNNEKQNRIDEAKRDYNEVTNIPVAPTRETGEIPDCDD